MEKLLYISRGLRDFDEICRADVVWPSWPSRPLKIWNFKNPRWRRPPSWKIEKSPYLSRGSTDFDAIWHDDALRKSWPSRSSKIWNFANPRWRRPPSWKSENSHISAAVWAISTKFGMMMQFDFFNRFDRYKFEISKIQDGGGRHIEKSKNRHISAAFQPILTKFGKMMHFEPLDRTDR